MHCNFCNTDKGAGDFYASNQTKCKECIKESVRKHRQENLERIRAYDRLRGSMPHRVAARKEYQETPAFAASHYQANERYRKAHPDRSGARQKLKRAVASGKVAVFPCQICGEGKAEAHHPDYSRPLDVVWLCNPHHRAAHAIVKELEEVA